MNLTNFKHLIYLINLIGNKVTAGRKSVISGKSGANKSGWGWGKTIINLVQNSCVAKL